MQYERHSDLRAMGRIRRLMPEYRTRTTQAKIFINSAFSECHRPYVALSGGKDSVAMLALVADVARSLERDVVAWSHVSDASFPGTIETCIDACRAAGVRLILDESPVSAFDVVGRQSRQRFGKVGYFFGRIKEFVDTGGYDLAFVGVRAAESKRRRDACRAHGPLFWSETPTGCWRSHPLQWFSLEDVAAVLCEYGMPMHPIYDQAPMGSMPIRLGYATSLDLLDRGTAVFMRRNYPALFRRLCDVYPPARNYT